MANKPGEQPLTLREDVRASIIAFYGATGSLKTVAKRFGISISTASSICNPPDSPVTASGKRGRLQYDPPSPELLEKKNQTLEQLFEAEIREGMGQLEATRADASYAQAGTVVGILTDKVLRIREAMTAQQLNSFVSDWLAATRDWIEAELPQAGREEAFARYLERVRPIAERYDTSPQKRGRQ